MSTTEGCLVVGPVREGADTSRQFAVTRGYRASEEARWRYVPRPTTGSHFPSDESELVLAWGWAAGLVETSGARAASSLPGASGSLSRGAPPPGRPAS